uniref:Protein kinase domain-containing protein n=1 Tax=viral metagenome TaxID=1070528 RepID=A0A6C0DZQ0_9ZZZZ
MDDKVSDVFYDKGSNEIKFKILKVDKEIDLNKLGKNFGQILNIVFDEKTNKPKYTHGGGNIIFYITDKEGQNYVLRHSLSEKLKIEDYRKEITKYYELSEMNIGVKIYYPLKEQVSSYNNKYIIIEYYEKGSVISFFDITFSLTKKEKAIDQIFDLIDKSIANKIYCLDVKFRNFVVKEKDEDVDVKMIDFEKCLLSIDDIIKSSTLTLDNKNLIYKIIILIQVFYSCPIYLQSYYLSKLDIEQIINVYNILYEEDNLKKSLKLFFNLFFYYLKNEFFKLFFTFEVKKLNDLDYGKLNMENETISIRELLRIKIDNTHNFFTEITLPLVHLCLYILFTRIVYLKVNYNNYYDKDTRISKKNKITFNPYFKKNKFIIELFSKFNIYQEDKDSTDDESVDDELCCLISDGKRRKSKKKKNKSIKRKKSKSIKRKKKMILNK